MATIDELNKRKRSIQSQITKLQTRINDHQNNPLTPILAELQLRNAIRQYEQSHTTREAINQLTTDADYAIHEKVFEDMDNKLETIQAFLTEIIRSSPTPGPTPVPTPTTAPTFQVKLPNLELPKFSGDINQWMPFRDQFTAAIHDNNKLSNVQKLTYLKSTLNGAASQILSSIASTDANYAVAWATLKNRFENKRELAFSTLKSFLEQPTMKGECATSLRKLIDVSNACLRALEVLQIPVEHWDVIIVFIMLQKVDSSTKQFWELSLADTAVPTFKPFIDFLEQRARALAAGGSSKSSTDAKHHRVRHGNSDNGRVLAHHANPVKCKICPELHPLYKCPLFHAMDIPTRINTIQQHKLCYNCLMDNHPVTRCTSKFSCKSCKKRHNSLIHRQVNAPGPVNAIADPVIPPQNFHSHSKLPRQGMLATALIKMTDYLGNLHMARAFLDCGSTSSFITESYAMRLGLVRDKLAVSVNGLGAAALGTTRGLVSAEFRSSIHRPGEQIFNIDMIVMTTLTSELPNQSSDPSKWPHLQNLTLADPNFYKSGKIDVLLGADVFWDILMDGVVTGGPGTPIARRSKLGWLIGGHTSLKTPQIMVHNADVDLDSRLQSFWELESVPKTRVWKREEKAAEKHFEETAVRDSSGRFTVSLPFKSTDKVLGASRDIAMKRFLGLERRLLANPQHKNEYIRFMDEYQKLGHMEPVKKERAMGQPEINNSSSTYYIPHHFVLKESSTSTKFRVVFDASSKSASGISLNDQLMVGPTIQDSLVSILMRFRTHIVALTADIKKMYRQIRVNPTQTDFQRILWRADPKDNVEEFRLLTVTYGTASAPFHATRALKQLAMDEQESFPVASEMAQRDFYVDDLMTGKSTTARAIEAHQELIQLTNRGGFELVKWWSNDPEVMAAIPEEMREATEPLNLSRDGLVKTLGLHWNPSMDSFTFKVHLTPVGPGKVTKRMFLSEMSKVFDPLGWIAPVIIRGKILFQRVWKAGTGWDGELPDDILEEWSTFRSHLSSIENIDIPRCIKPEMTTQVGLHGFCDASEKAYAAVVYTKAYQHNGPPRISLITSKTRVAPSNPITLPRLELCGALLLGKLMTTVQDSLVLNFVEINAWTDSTVVLAWIRGDSARWKTFVANRVTEIQENIPSHLWGHVDGISNPADCASRGIDPDDLHDHSLWWDGPDWLKSATPDPTTTGTELGPVCMALVEEERKHTIINATAQVNFDLSMLTSSSSLWKLKRVSAWMFRFIQNCQSRTVNNSHPIRTGPLSTDELEHGLLHWVKLVQGEEFGAEIQALRAALPIKRCSKFRSLNLFLDQTGLLRVGGRLQNAPIPEDQKTPILIPHNHRLTELIIQNEHKRTLHGGPQLVLSMLQRRFWIPQGKNTVRHQIRKCIICCRHKGETMQQFMGNLPASRVTPSRPFLTCGVDYAGPFSLRAVPGRSKVTYKGYLALFICFVTHAVHLELVSSLSTDAFLAALKRFTSRRGLCRDIHSDCGTNFVGANREMKDWLTMVKSKAHNQVVATKLSEQGIKWHFNPPGAPHFGGLWEAGVKSAKYHLHRIMGSARFTFEEMTTVFAQIEACLNSRPLTPVSTNPDDLTALTAGHFLIGDSLLAIPEPDLTKEKVNRLTRFQLIQQVTQHFWRRWSREFLSRLQQRPKWAQQRANCEIGDMVLIKDDNLPPLKWRLGRIVATHPGADGLIRVATVKTAEGEVKRPIVKLCLLPMETNDGKED